MPIPFPDWLPWWVPVLVLIPVVLYALVFLLMPFSVFGLKGRLDAIEAQLNDVHEEIRALGARLPEDARADPHQDVRRNVSRLTAPLPYEPPPTRPPIPTALPEEPEPRRRPSTGMGERAEPRLDWPR
jgi:hypothetical protein